MAFDPNKPFTVVEESSTVKDVSDSGFDPNKSFSVISTPESYEDTVFPSHDPPAAVPAALYPSPIRISPV